MAQTFRNLTYLADTSGCGMWRHLMPMQSVNCIASNFNMVNTATQTPILDANYYKGITSVTVQRWISDYNLEIFMKLLKPVCDANSAFLIYEIDDCMAAKYIQLYNRGREAYESPKIQSNIKTMLNAADLLVVTTDYIKNFYHEWYGVPLENIVALPNFLPRWWFGDRYEPEKKVNEFNKNKARPRIGIVSSLSHYNVDDVRITKDGLAARKKKDKGGKEVWKNEKGEVVKEEDLSKITDDMTELIPMIAATAKDFQWVFLGYCPDSLKPLVDKKIIEVHQGSAIMNYASALENLHLQAIVAPITKNVFNYCKSFIKYMECAAIGVPCFATNCEPYSRVMPKHQLFDTAEELKAILLKLKFSSAGAYKSMIESQWKWLNTPCHEGSFDIKNFWLEDNLGIHIDLRRLRQKPMNISLKLLGQNYEKRQEIEKQNTLFETAGGAKIMR